MLQLAMWCTGGVESRPAHLSAILLNTNRLDPEAPVGIFNIMMESFVRYRCI